jgi:drug/metabolite transporter (DMT)-like permease
MPQDSFSSPPASDFPNVHAPKRRAQMAVLELVLAGSLWGFGFIAAVWTLRAWPPLSATGARFVLALAVGGPIALLVPSLRRNLRLATLLLAMIPGFFLSATIVFQTWGLKYTTATKSGFITCLYVLLVPILERVWTKRRLPKFHFLFVILALLGVALICDFPAAVKGTLPADQWHTTADELKLRWNIGDFLTLVCSLASTLHIVWLGRIRSRIQSAFVFNLAQSFWGALPPVALGLWLETQPSFQAVAGLPLIGMCSLAFGSTLIAFALQIRAQKEISPSLVSLLFLLESPFATLFAIYFLHERLRTPQWAGAGLIMAAVLLSTIFDFESSQLADP